MSEPPAGATGPQPTGTMKEESWDLDGVDEDVEAEQKLRVDVLVGQVMATMFGADYGFHPSIRMCDAIQCYQQRASTQPSGKEALVTISDFVRRHPEQFVEVREKCRGQPHCHGCLLAGKRAGAHTWIIVLSEVSGLDDGEEPENELGHTGARKCEVGQSLSTGPPASDMAVSVSVPIISVTAPKSPGSTGTVSQRDDSGHGGVGSSEDKHGTHSQDQTPPGSTQTPSGSTQTLYTGPAPSRSKRVRGVTVLTTSDSTSSASRGAVFLKYHKYSAAKHRVLRLTGVSGGSQEAGDARVSWHDPVSLKALGTIFCAQITNVWYESLPQWVTKTMHAQNNQRIQFDDLSTDDKETSHGVTTDGPTQVEGTASRDSGGKKYTELSESNEDSKKNGKRRVPVLGVYVQQDNDPNVIADALKYAKRRHLAIFIRTLARDLRLEAMTLGQKVTWVRVLEAVRPRQVKL